MYNAYNQIMVASMIGLSSCCTTFLCSMLTPIEHNTDWRDLAFYGSLGSLIASRYLLQSLK